MSVVDLPRYNFERASSLEGLCESLAAHAGDPGGVRLLAGGTDLMVQISQGPVAPDPLPHIVDISRLEALRGIEEVEGGLRIGAAATYAEIARHPLVQARLPMVARMTVDVGGPTIQANATLEIACASRVPTFRQC